MFYACLSYFSLIWGAHLEVLLGLLWPEVDAVPYGGGVHLQVLVGLLWPELDAVFYGGCLL